MNDLSSIENLLNPTGENGDEGSVGAQLSRKQQEIKSKEIEKQTETKARAAGFNYVNLNGFPISPEALIMIAEDEAKLIKGACFFYDGQTIRLAFLEYSAAIKAKVEELKTKYFTEIKLYLISRASFSHILDFYASLPKTKKKYAGVEVKEADLEKFKNEISSYKSLNEKINEVNISDIVTLLLASAMKTGASDIHIEAEENRVVIRLRIDGVLQEAAIINKSK
ncbi:MAG: hypothetical protein NTX66_04260 [Candidatus Falkowbacteria bacterium]|nr:hypothetical protein [Candidatus Falkowbacteria bacterium]